MMFAYFLGLGQGTGNMAEARALLYGVLVEAMIGFGKKQITYS